MCFQIQRVIPRSGIPGSYNSMFNLLWKCQTAFHSGCTILCSPLRLILTPGCFSRVRLFVTPWTVAPLSMGFSRQEYWKGLPFPPSGNLPNTGCEPSSPCLPHCHTGSLPLAPPGKLKPFIVKCYSSQTDSSVPGPMLLCLPFQGLKNETLFHFASWAYKMSSLFPDI